MGIQENISTSLQKLNMGTNNKTTDEYILDIFLTEKATFVSMNACEYPIILVRYL